MFRTSLLSFIFLLVLSVSSLEVQGSIFSTESVIKPTDTLCVNVLQENKYFAETEAQMKGYGKSDVAGLDHVMENLRLVQSLRTRPIDPYTTHIPEFADLIDEHIGFVRKGIMI